MAAHTLVCGANWLGDTVMSMPAVQLMKRTDPGSPIAILVKPPLAPLWRMHPDVDLVLTLGGGMTGIVRSVREVRGGSFTRAFLFSNSFRSALVPYLSRVAERSGKRGHGRAWMLTRIAEESTRPDRRHQVWEYLEIAGLAEACAEPERPAVTVPAETMEEARGRFALAPGETVLGLLPGAARGPSKRWPAAHFAETGRRLADAVGCRILVLGAPDEHDLCAGVAAAIGRRAVNTAGSTTLPSLCALLTSCRVVVANDSGGMHLAAACGASVVAVYGLTDPSKTGPLGTSHTIVARPGVTVSRAIARDSDEAAACLRSIEPAAVAEAAESRWRTG